MSGGSGTKKKGAGSRTGTTKVPNQPGPGDHQVDTTRQAGGVRGPASRNKPAAIRGAVAHSSRKHEPPLEPSRLARLGPGAILFWVLAQFATLVALFLMWEADKLNPASFPAVYHDVMPLAVPWFGALGGVANAMYSLTRHWAKWDSIDPKVRGPERARWNGWALLQGLIGSVFGTVSVLIVVLVTGTIAGTESGGLNLSTTGIGLLCAVSFAVGFRQATFQTLIKRTVDILAGPGTGSDEDVSFTVAPASLTFATTRGKPSEAQEVSVTNLGSSLLVLWGGNVTLTQPTSAFRVTLPGNLASGESGQIRVWFDPGTEKEPSAGWEAELSVSVEGMARKVALTGNLEPPPDDGDANDPPGPQTGKKKSAKKAGKNGDAGKNGTKKAAKKAVQEVLAGTAGAARPTKAAAAEAATRPQVTKKADKKAGPVTDAAVAESAKPTVDSSADSPEGGTHTAGAEAEHRVDTNEPPEPPERSPVDPTE